MRFAYSLSRSLQNAASFFPVAFALALPAVFPPARAQDATRGPRVLTNSIDAKLALIPAGEFLMGSLPHDDQAEVDEKPQHRVRITRPFYLGVTEVTRRQFRAFVNDTGYQTEAEKDGKGGWGWNEETKDFEQNPRFTWRNPGFEQADEHPVVNVSWNDARVFIAWLTRKERRIYRLPTEAEWEYACRAGTTTRYSCGNDPECLAAVGNVADGTLKARYPDRGTIRARDGYVYTAPVGRFRSNAFGLYDMHGNIWEWCSDGYDDRYYEASPREDPPGPTRASRRVNRGYGWLGNSRHCRSADRSSDPPEHRNSMLGFRLALEQPGR
jgi:formylglycine-generating enzyme required for sulfatase activity